jgi:hypothetical protein
MADIDHKIDLIGMAQPDESTCWLASYKMLLKKAGKPYGDDDIKAKFKIFKLDFDDAKANGLDGKDWVMAAFALGFTPMPPQLFTVDGGILDRLVGKTSGQKAFLNLLTAGPLWIGRRVAKGKSHAIIARGYNSSKDQVIWINPQRQDGGKDAFEDVPSRLANFIGLIAFPMGGVQFIGTGK